MRVYVEHDMTVNHNTSVVSLKAGQVVEGPLAVYLVESDCAVTIEQDDRPAAEAAPAETTSTDGQGPDGGQSHTPGAGEQSEAVDPVEEPAETSAEPGAAE